MKYFLNLSMAIALILTIANTYGQTGPGGVGNNTTNVLWLRSNDLSLSDGDDISTWSDYTSHSNNVVQSDNSLNPIFKTNIVNSFPVVRFNKANNRIRKNNFNDFPTTEITAIYVNKNDGESSDGILSYASSANNNDYLLYGSNNLNPHIRNDYYSSGISYNDNIWHIVNHSWKSSDGESQVWKDGSLEDIEADLKTGISITGDGCLAIAGEQDSVDGSYDSGQAHFGDFSEIIIYNTFLNNAQQIIVSNYLSAKYDTSLASNDYYLQDNNGSGDYDFNVAGIGQANDGSNHIESKGSSIITINNPSSLSDNDYLFWGENSKDNNYFFKSTSDNTLRLDAVWRVSKNQDLGAVDISIDKLDLSGMTSCSQLKFIVSNTSDFSAKTSYDLTLVGDVYSITNINFTDGDYFTIEFSTNQGYTGPGGVGNCETIPLWLRAEDITLADGTDIDSWSDYSGNNNDVSQTDASFQPVFQENAVNSYPVVYFNKSNNRLIKENFTDFPSGEITSIYVNKNDNESKDGILSYASTKYDNDYLLYGSNKLYPHRPNSVSSGVVLNDNDWHSANTSWKSDGRVVNVWKDGSDDFTGNSNSSYKKNITKNGCLAIAAEQDAVNGSYNSSQTHNGYFTEIIFYNYALNTAKHIIVSNYLSAKYNYPLSANDFFSQDDSGNGDFDHKVAGIGQAPDGSNHTDSQGTGIIRINTPSNLSNDDYLFWGEETKDATYEFTTTAEYTERLNTKWRVNKRNDLGTVSLHVDENDIDLSGKNTCAGLKLIVSGSSNFATKTTYDMTLVSGVYSATNVNFSDGDYFSFEYFDLIVVDDTKFYNGSGTNNVPDTTDGCYKLLVKNTADGTLSLTEDAVVREIEVETNGKLKVNDGLKLEVNETIKLDGTIRLFGEAQLLQNGTGVSTNSGTGHLLKDKTGSQNAYNYNYWCSPVQSTGANNTVASVIFDGSTPDLWEPATPDFISGYDGTNGAPIGLATFWFYKYIDGVVDPYNEEDWVALFTGTTPNTDAGSVMLPGQGYTMKGTNIAAVYEDRQNYTFKGKPNNGEYTLSISEDKEYLVGNPYPSALDADDFIDTNIGVIDGTLYFWHHWGSDTHIYNDYSAGYATYTKVGGTASQLHPDYAGNTDPGALAITPKRYIPVAQGFLVRSEGTAGGNIIFNNSQRNFMLEGVNSVAIKSNSNKNASQKIRLGYIAPDGRNRHLLFGYMEEATDGVDLGYDGVMIDLWPDDLYFVIEDNYSVPFIIQAANSYNVNAEYPLVVKIDTSGLHTIKIDELENFEEDIYVMDDNGITHNITESDYEFYTTTESERIFKLVFKPNSTTGLNENVTNAINAYYFKQEIVIDNHKEYSITEVQVYNMLGQLVMQVNDTNKLKNSKIYIPFKNFEKSAYVLKIESGAGTSSYKFINF